MRTISNTLNGQLRRAVQSLFTGNGLDYGLYGRLFQLLSDHHLPLQAKQLHARLILFSVTPDNFLGSKLINFYGKTNHLSDARHVFDKIPRKNAFSYNAMLIAYSFSNCPTGVLKLFSLFLGSGSVYVKPDNISVTCLLKSLSGSLLLGKEVHGYVLRHGFDADVFVENALITYYSKCDDLGLARRVFDRMGKRDVVTWNSMIAGYSQGGFYEECKELYKEMVNCSGFRPNGITMLSVLQACAQSYDLIFGMDVHRFLFDNKLEMDISLCNALISLYAKCGSMDYARELFMEMSEKDDVTYGAIISGYMLHGFVNEGMDLFREMKSRGLSTWNSVISGLVQNNQHEGVLDLVREMQTFGFKPNAVTLSSILPTLSFYSNLQAGKEIHAYAVKHNYDQNIYVATAIIDTYAKSGFLRGSQRVFNQSKGRSLIIWTAIISAYAAHGDADSALSIFDDMLFNGIQPDAVTFTSVLAACAHCGMVDKAWEIFDSMFKTYGIHPLVEHYACMVGVLSRAGRLSEATRFVSKMPMEPSAKVWGALLQGASICGDVELGKFVCDHLFRTEPENTGNYIIMANLYSQAGRWKEADDVRERMTKFGLMKIPGSSWIETSSGLQSFTAMETSNENTEDICVMLETLLGLMREEGNILQDELAGDNVYG